MLLQKSNLVFAFTRAVVYALLRDPDQVLYGRENPMFRLMTMNFMPVVGGEKCTNCKNLLLQPKNVASARKSIIAAKNARLHIGRHIKKSVR